MGATDWGEETERYLNVSETVEGVGNETRHLIASLLNDVSLSLLDKVVLEVAHQLAHHTYDATYTISALGGISMSRRGEWRGTDEDGVSEGEGVDVLAVLVELETLPHERIHRAHDLRQSEREEAQRLRNAHAQTQRVRDQGRS
jgi:hypothetical protein